MRRGRVGGGCGVGRVTAGSSTLNEQQQAEMEELTGERYVAVQDGAQGLSSRKDRRALAKAQRKRPADQVAGTIGVLSGRDTTHRAFALSVMNLGTLNAAISWIRGADIARARNQIVENMQGDWLWFLDDDHDFDANIVRRLLQHKADIVAPLVLAKVPPFSPVCYRDIGDPYKLSDLPTSGLVEVAATGTAGMLIRRRVFEQMPAPWFVAGQIHKDGVGEDLNFCVNAREAGFKVRVDTGAVLGHLTTTSVRPTVDEETGEWNVGLGFDRIVIELAAP